MIGTCSAAPLVVENWTDTDPPGGGPFVLAPDTAINIATADGNTWQLYPDKLLPGDTTVSVGGGTLTASVADGNPKENPAGQNQAFSAASVDVGFLTDVTVETTVTHLGPTASAHGAGIGVRFLYDGTGYGFGTRGNGPATIRKYDPEGPDVDIASVAIPGYVATNTYGLRFSVNGNSFVGEVFDGGLGGPLLATVMAVDNTYPGPGAVGVGLQDNPENLGTAMAAEFGPVMIIPEPSAVVLATLGLVALAMVTLSSRSRKCRVR